ncbi:MAG: hypothetical protein KAJ49_09805 [Arcobacteraceae bacterium]|nr:hypothetical protein [Arcobacteraceae bacterium]
MKKLIISAILSISMPVFAEGVYISLDVNPDTISLGYIANDYVSLEVGVSKVKVRKTIKSTKKHTKKHTHTPNMCDKGTITSDDITADTTEIFAEGKCVYLENIGTAVDSYDLPYTITVYGATNVMKQYSQYEWYYNRKTSPLYNTPVPKDIVLKKMKLPPDTQITTVAGFGKIVQEDIYDWESDVTHTYSHTYTDIFTTDFNIKNTIKASVLLHSDLNKPVHVFAKYSYNKRTKSSTFIGIGSKITQDISARLGYSLENNRVSFGLVWKF